MIDDSPFDIHFIFAIGIGSDSEMLKRNGIEFKWTNSQNLF